MHRNTLGRTKIYILFTHEQLITKKSQKYKTISSAQQRELVVFIIGPLSLLIYRSQKSLQEMDHTFDSTFKIWWCRCLEWDTIAVGIELISWIAVTVWWHIEADTQDSNVIILVPQSGQPFQKSKNIWDGKWQGYEDYFFLDSLK